MLEGLDQIDWYKLGHAYGDASDVPAMIRALASRKKATRDKAWDDLFGSVRHQGSIYSATPRVVPFLIELLGEPSVLAKAEVLQNLCGYAPDYGYWEPYYGEEEPPGLDTHPTRTAIEDGISVYATFLDDPDPDIRSWAARLLTVCFRQRDAVARTLRSHIPAEGDPAVRVVCVFQLAILNRSSDGRFFASLGRDDRSPLVRLAASLARVHLRPEKPPADAVAVIERAAKSSRDLLSQLPKDERVVDVALEAVAKRPAGVRSLLAMLKSRTVAVRKDAVQKLSHLNPCPPEAVRGMIRALGDSNAEVRSWTAFDPERFLSRRYATAARADELIDWLDFAHTADRGMAWIDDLRGRPSRDSWWVRSPRPADLVEIDLLRRLVSRDRVLQGYCAQYRHFCQNRTRPSEYQRTVEKLDKSLAVNDCFVLVGEPSASAT